MADKQQVRQFGDTLQRNYIDRLAFGDAYYTELDRGLKGNEDVTDVLRILDLFRD